MVTCGGCGERGYMAVTVKVEFPVFTRENGTMPSELVAYWCRDCGQAVMDKDFYVYAGQELPVIIGKRIDAAGCLKVEQGAKDA